MANMEVELVLTGARAGQTGLLNGHYFRKGAARVKVGPESVDTLLTYMGRVYQAYLTGSEELQRAQERDRKSLERRRALNGVRSDLSPNTAKADGASAPIQSSGVRDASGAIPEARTLHSDEHVSGETGSEGLVSGGSGHENAGVGHGVDSGQDFESGFLTDPLAPVRVALAKLNAAADDHWTDDGFPSVAAVAEALHDQSVTRAMIAQAAPGYNRTQASELAGL